MKDDANRKPSADAAESETLSMRGNSMHGNRETRRLPRPLDAGRSEKANSRTSDMHVSGESDDPIVPDEAGEQSRPEGGGGVRGGKGIDQGKRRALTTSPDTEPEYDAWLAIGTYGPPAVASVRSTRGRSRMR